MAERLTERRKAEEWCLGYRVPAIVVWRDGNVETKTSWGSPITVSALNPREKNGSRLQPKGLFLDGPKHDDPNLAEVLAIVRKKTIDEILRVVVVTKKVKMSWGPGM